MALIDKLKAIGDGFRSSRGTTQTYTLDDMAVLAAEPVGSSGGSEMEEQFIATLERDINKPLTKLPDGLTKIGGHAFYNYSNLALTSLPTGLTAIDTYAFYGCSKLALTSLPPGLTSIGTSAFYGCTGLTAITFEGKPNTITSNAFSNCTNLLTINVPWAEGEVSNAPWGATNATINYNYVKQVDKYSWGDVLASIDAGTYATDYSIGDTIPLYLGSEGLINMQIAAFDTDDLADGSGKAPITWVSKELLKNTKRMNPSMEGESGARIEGTGAIGGWEKCEMRSYLKNTIKPLIPENVRNSIKEVAKTQKAFDTSQAEFVQTTSDDVWIPASLEVKNTEPTHYSLFTNADNLKKTQVGKTTASTWWCRNAGVNAKMICVNANGSIGSDFTYDVYGVCLCFCT